MDRDTVESLKPYERTLDTAYRLGYANIILSDFKRMLSIYYKTPEDHLVQDKKISPSVFSCGRCRLNALKAIAKEYFTAISNNKDKQ